MSEILKSSRVLTNIKERTNCYGIHHERDHGNTPSHYKLANRFALPKGVAKHEKTTDVQRNSYVACMPCEFAGPPLSR